MLLRLGCVLLLAHLACQPRLLADPPARATDRAGDALPDGALARLGTTRWGCPATIQQLAFAPDGKTLAVGCEDRTVRLFDLANGKELRRFGDTFQPRAVFAFSPDGKGLLVASNHALLLFDPATGKELRRFDHPGDCRSVAFSPDGNRFAAGCQGIVRLCESRTGKVVRELPWPGKARLLVFSADGKQLAGRSEFHPSGVQVWDLASGKLLVDDPDGYSSQIHSLAFAADGKKLVGMAWKELKFWDLAAGKRCGGIAIESAWGTIGLDGRVFAEMRDGAIVLADLETGKRIRQLDRPTSFRGEVGPAVFSPDGKLFAYAADRQLRLVDAARGLRLSGTAGHDAALWDVAFAPDGRTIATASKDGTVRLWTADGRELWRSARQPVICTSVAFAPDSKVVAATTFDDHRVWLWEASTGKVLHVLPRHEGIIDHLVFTDRETLLTFDRNQNRRRWNVAGGKERPDSRHPDELVASLLPSQDGRLIAARLAFDSNHSGNVRVEKLLTETRWLAGEMTLTPDGRMLVWVENGQSSQNVVLHLVEVFSGQERLRIPLGDVCGLKLTFSPNGTLLAVPTADGRVLVHELATGKSLRLHHAGSAWASIFLRTAAGLSRAATTARRSSGTWSAGAVSRRNWWS